MLIRGCRKSPTAAMPKRARGGTLGFADGRDMRKCRSGGLRKRAAPRRCRPASQGVAHLPGAARRITEFHDRFKGLFWQTQLPRLQPSLQMLDEGCYLFAIQMMFLAKPQVGGTGSVVGIRIRAY